MSATRHRRAQPRTRRTGAAGRCVLHAVPGACAVQQKRPCALQVSICSWYHVSSFIAPHTLGVTSDAILLVSSFQCSITCRYIRLHSANVIV